MGTGKYQIAWLMRGPDEVFCSGQWKVSAGTRGKDRKIQPSLHSGIVQAEPTEIFESDAAKPASNHGLKVLVLLHVSPRMTGSFETRSEETLAVASILRRISRESRIGVVSIVAFNLERNEILYRGRNSSQVDFRALGNAVNRFKPYFIDFKSLREQGAGVHGLGELISGEMKDQPDAVIFVGPRTRDDRLIPASAMELNAPPCPVFYLDYVPRATFLRVPGPVACLSRDPIGRIVKRWKGYEYTISKPRDLFTAWNDVMNRVSNTRTGILARREPDHVSDF
jgi:hypothetical protein